MCIPCKATNQPSGTPKFLHCTGKFIEVVFFIRAFTLHIKDWHSARTCGILRCTGLFIVEAFDCSTLQEAMLQAPIIDIYLFLVETSVCSQRIRLAMLWNCLVSCLVCLCAVLIHFKCVGKKWMVMFHLFHRSTVATFMDKWHCVRAHLRNEKPCFISHFHQVPRAQHTFMFRRLLVATHFLVCHIFYIYSSVDSLLLQLNFIANIYLIHNTVSPVGLSQEWTKYWLPPSSFLQH